VAGPYRVEVIDPRNEALFDRFYAVVRAVFAFDWPQRSPWERRVLQGRALATEGQFETLDLLAFDAADVAVAAGWMELPRLDNLELAQCTLYVHPDHRRAGAGSALLEAMESVADRRRRPLLGCRQDEAPDLGEGVISPGARFARRHGFTLGQRELRRHLLLPADPERVERLGEECRTHAQGYEVRCVVGRCPEELIDDRCELGRAMSRDAPSGDLEHEEERWDEARVRSLERILLEQGRTLFSAYALHSESGSLVAFSEMVVSEEIPETAYQWDTMVLQAHRGHRLGALVKLANLAQLAELSPITVRIETTNDVVNAPMVAINEALGFVVGGLVNAWQKRRD
jgi:GNAT superfamily N-acetyltransferase